MYRRVIHKNAILEGILIVVVGFAFLALGIYAAIASPKILVIMPIVPTVSFIGGFVILNRLGGYVIIDKEKQIISRKGRFFGFRYSVKFEDIENVVIAKEIKVDEFIVIVDKAHVNSTEARIGSIIVEKKKSCIAIENTDENMELIRQIWEGPILAPQKFGDDNAFS